MSASTYKHRSAYPALVAAGVFLAFGGILSLGLQRRAEEGLADPSIALGVGCFFGVLACMCVINGFTKKHKHKHERRVPRY